MIRATISEVKNGLSGYLRRVKSGESVLVTERRTPVARIVPVGRDTGRANEVDDVDRTPGSRDWSTRESWCAVAPGALWTCSDSPCDRAPGFWKHCSMSDPKSAVEGRR